MNKKIIFIISFTLLFLLLLSVLFNAAEPFIKNRIIAAAEKQTGLELEIDQFKLSLPAGIYARGIRLSQQDGNILAAADTIRARVSVIELFRKHLAFHLLAADSLLVHRELVSDFGEPSGGRFQWPISVRSIELKNSAFIYNDRKLEVDITEGDFSYRPGADFRLLLEETLLSGNSSGFKINRLEVCGVSEEERLEFEKISVSMPDFEVYGHLHTIKSPPFNIAGAFNASGRPGKILEQAGAFFNYDLPPFQGHLTSGISLEGTRKKPQLSLTMSLKDFSLGTRNFSTAEIKGSFKEERIILDKATVVDRFGAQAILEGTYETHPKLLTLQTEIKNAPLQDSPYLPDLPETITGGFINGRVSFSGPVEKPRRCSGSAEFTLTGAYDRGKSLEDIIAEINFKQGRTSLNLETGDNRIQASGGYSDQSVWGNFSMNFKTVENLTRYAGLRDLTGTFSAEGQFSATAETFKANADIKPARLLYNRLPVKITGGKISTEDGLLSFRDIAATGNFELGKKTIITDRLAQLEGRLNYNITVNGTLQNPLASFEVRLASPSFKTFSAGRFYARGKYSNETPSLETFFLQKDDHLFLSRSLFRPLQKKGTINLKTYKVPGGLSMTCRDLLQKTRDELDPVGNSEIFFDISKATQVILSLEEEGLQVQALEEFFDLPFPLRGIAGGSARIKGSFKNPRLNADLFLEDALIGETEIHRAECSLQMEDEIVQLSNFKIRTDRRGRAEGSLSFKVLDIENLRFRPDPEYYSSGSIVLEDIDFTAVNPFLKKASFDSGRASAQMELSGKPLHPSAEGNLKLKNLSLTTADGNQIRNMNAAASFKDRGATIETFSASLGEKLMDMRGKIKNPSRGHWTWDLRVKDEKTDRIFLSGNLKDNNIFAENKIAGFVLSDISEYIPGIRNARGELNAEVTVEGKVHNPKILGNLDIKNFAGTVAGLEENLDRGRASILFDENQIKIKKLLARSRGGSIEAGGKITHKSLKLSSMDMEVSAENLRVELPDLGKGIVNSASLAVSGEKENFFLTGQINLGEFLIIAEDTATADAGEEKEPGLIDNFTIDLYIHSADKLWVYNRAGRIRLEGKLNLAGRASHPVLTGRLTAREGYIMYLDRKFNISEGFVDFDGRPRNIPYIDMAALARIRSLRQVKDDPYRVRVHAHGRLDDLQIDLSSRPELKPPDIISLLTFGATRGQLTETESLLSLRAEEIASMRIAGYVSAYAGNILNLDLIVVEGNVFRPGSAEGPRVRAQKNISENIALETLTYHTGRSNIGLKYSIWIR